MVAEMGEWHRFREWQIFEELEPHFEDQMNYHAAHLVQTLWNIYRDTEKHPEPFPLGKFLMYFGDAQTVQPPPVVQPLEHQERLIDMWIMGSNALFQAKEASGS